MHATHRSLRVRWLCRGSLGQSSNERWRDVRVVVHVWRGRESIVAEDVFGLIAYSGPVGGCISGCMYTYDYGRGTAEWCLRDAVRATPTNTYTTSIAVVF